MDIILHLGAHRTATTTFQHYTRDQRSALAAQKVEFWGPQYVRKSVFPGLFRKAAGRQSRNIARRAQGRAGLFAAQAEARGVERLLVSDENLLGTCRDNLRQRTLYPAAGERVAKVAQALGLRLNRIVLSIRAQDLWWASASALTVSRGHPVPRREAIEAIARSRRTWRDVITDVACAAPDVALEVVPFESYAGRPDHLLATAMQTPVRPDKKHHWLNRSPDTQALRAEVVAMGGDPSDLPDEMGRWQPFTPEQAARLRENYADDLHWLKAGADGLARLIEDRPSKRVDTSPPPEAMTKGQTDERYEGQLAQDG